MNRIRMGIVLFITILLQNTVFSRIQILGVQPNVALPVIVLLSIGFSSYAGGFSGLTIGLVEDILFSPVIGYHALIYFVTGFVIGNFEYRLNIKDNKTGMLITALATLGIFAFELVVSLFTGSSAAYIAHLKGPLLLEILMNSLLYYGVAMGIGRLFIFPNVRFY
ncbi:MAG: rod shape-determining protein MreD [Tissierellia bacterium]|nr:rod shape-determining protein MreD [Tissierellia bacterium]